MRFSAVVLGLVCGSVAGFTHPAKNTVSSVVLSSTVEKTTFPVSFPLETISPPSPNPAVEEAKTELEKSMSIVMVEKKVSNLARIQPGRYEDIENSIAIPFLKRPPALDGTHAGDFGFDPLGFTEEYDLYTLQESEIRHARLAMLAVIGWPISELVAPDWMLQNGCAPSVLNGFNPLSFFATVAAFGALGAGEYFTSLRKVDDKKLGKIHSEDMADIWKWGVAGDYNFDPLNLYSSIGNDAKARKGLRELEISHGRSAMLGITSFVVWEALTGHPIVENSMFFHPNLLLPSLVAGYAAFWQFYEIDEEVADTFLRFKMSSEGQARLENLKMSVKVNESTQQKMSEFASKAQDFLSELPSKYAAMKDAYMDKVVKYED